jgi:hypothetical protein
MQKIKTEEIMRVCPLWATVRSYAVTYFNYYSIFIRSNKYSDIALVLINHVCIISNGA